MDYILDLRKNGSVLGTLANSTSDEYSISLPNKSLPLEFKEQLNVLFNYFFGQQMTDDGNTLLLRFENGVFKRVYTPSIVRGNLEHEKANNPDLLYIRWGNDFKPLFLQEKKVGNKITVNLLLEEGNEESLLDYSIEGYNFHGDGETYLDPALQVTFIADNGDAFVMPLALRCVLCETTDGTRHNYVNSLKIALKRGAANFLEKIAPVVDFSTLPECLEFNSLPKMQAIAVVGKDSFISKRGDKVTKLIVRVNTDVTQVWCPYFLLNYVNSDSFKATAENPKLLVYLDDEEVVNEKTGVVYKNPIFAIEGEDGFAESKFNLQNFPLGTTINENDSNAFLELSKQLVLDPYRFLKTLNDYDLEVHVRYLLLSYEEVPTKSGSLAYRLFLRNPATKEEIRIWCPNRLLPTLKLQPVITPENPSVFVVVNTKTRKADGKVFADSIIELSSAALPQKSFDFSFA